MRELVLFVIVLAGCGVSFDVVDGEAGGGGAPERGLAGGGSAPVSSGGGERAGGGGAAGGIGDTGGAGGAGGAPDPCVGAPHTFGGHCYELLSADRTWDEARAACQALGRGWDLMGYADAAERDFLDEVGGVTGQIWTGGRDVTSSDTYTWVNGEPWTFAPWGGAVEPDGGGEDCVRIIPNDGAANDTLHDTVCTSVFPHAWCEQAP